MSTTEDKISTAGTWAGAVTALLSGLTVSEWGVIFGMVLGGASFAYNIYHKWALRKILRDKPSITISVDDD